MLIWFKAEKVSADLGVHIETMTNTYQLSAKEYFIENRYPSSHPAEITARDATEVDFHGVVGVEFTTMAIADQYRILVPYKDYMVALTILYGGPAGPHEMTHDDNRFMKSFLGLIEFMP